MKNSNESHTSWFPEKCWELNSPCLWHPELGNSSKSHTKCFVRLSCEGAAGREGGQEAVAPVLRGRILPGSRDSDRGHPARSGRLPGTVHPAGTCGPPTGGERVPGMQKQAGGESGQRRPPRAAAGWPPARGLLAAGGLRVIPKPRTPSSTRDARSHERGPWVGHEQSPARAAGRVDGSRGSRQGLGVGAQGRLSPKCPSQRGPGDNRTGW